MAGISDDIRSSFKNGTAVVKLIYINLGIFIFLKLIYVLFFLLSPVADKSTMFHEKVLVYLMLPSDLPTLMYRPWGVLTYMFLHSEFFHILFNLLFLFWFGRIFLKYLNEKQLYTTYLLGGFAGALFFVLSYNIFPGLTPGAPALGASAAVTAIVIAISFYAPDHRIYLLFFGQVKLKYLAVFFILLDLLMIPGLNAGGHIAHLGGAVYGYLFAVQLKNGKDIGRGFSRLADSLAVIFRQRPRLEVSYKKNAKHMSDKDYNRIKAENQKEIDKILDKIAKSGYDSLSKQEKEILFRMSNKS